MSDNLEKFKNTTTKFNATTPTDNTVERSLSLITTSLYKMQIGVNSVRDEIKKSQEVQIEILKCLDRIAVALESSVEKKK